MESEGVPIPSASSSPPPPVASDDHPDVSPTGSPDLSDHDNHQQPPAPPSSDQPPAVLTDELRDKIIKQVEYYFSDENLPSDKYLMKYVSKDKGGYVPVGVVASFRKMKKLTKDVSLIATALRESSLLVVSPNGKKVKRLHPLPAEVMDPMLCTVVVENLPNDHSVENLQRIFGEAGKIQKIVIRDPHDARDSRKLTTTEKLLTTKLHALVEYDTVEAAERAVLSLNNAQDWRYGLRVKLLKKKTKTEGKAEVKADARKKVWQEVGDEKNNAGQATSSVVEEENHCSSDHHDDSHDEEEGHLLKERSGEHAQKDKTGEHQQKENNAHRNRSRGRRKRQQYNGTNGHGQGHSHGHGTPPNSHHIGRGHGTPPNSHHFEPSKPPPGPKMPDGTRGFTLGRGRPLQPNQS